jgi:septal ring-binding cell division protein DamX
MDFEDNNKLFVFDKKEVILIFVFVIVITITAFTMGVRVGKNLSLKADGYTAQDIAKTLELKSVEEEHADSVFEKNAQKDDSQELLNTLADPERLDKEFSEISKTGEESRPESNLAETLPSDLSASSEEITPKDANNFKGKFTINLASKQTKEEASEFAAPYMASDLEVVINRVEMSNKGVWYRVGIGIFNSYNEAKDFLDKNPVYFKGKKYWITEIK